MPVRVFLSAFLPVYAARLTQIQLLVRWPTTLELTLEVDASADTYVTMRQWIRREKRQNIEIQTPNITKRAEPDKE